MMSTGRRLMGKEHRRLCVMLPLLCRGLSSAPPAACMPKAGKAQWRLINPDPRPVARSSHGMSFNPSDGYVYCWGGEHVARHAIDAEVWRFKEDRWSTAATTGSAPKPRVAHSQAITEGGLFIWGGRQGEGLGEGDLGDLHKLDLRSMEWEQIVAENGPSARSYQQMCATPGKLHVFGGCAGHDRLADLHTFDLASGRWTRQPDNELIRGRGGAGFEADNSGKRLFVIAGFAGEEMNDVYIFDLESQRWDTVPSASLQPRSVFPLCALPNKIVMFGGEVDPSAAGHSGAGNFANDLIALDTDTLAWSAIETDIAPPERGWTRMVATTDKTCLLFGGLNGDDANPARLDDTWEVAVQF